MAYTGPRGSGQVLLSDYLTKNREAGKRMGTALADKVQAGASGYRGAVDKASADFRGRLGSIPFADPRSMEGMTEDEKLLALKEADEFERQADARIAFLKSGAPEGANKGKVYDALDDVADLGALGGMGSRAQQQAQLAGTGAGRGTLLREQFGAGNAGYSIGSSMLDSALAGAGAGRRLTQASRGNTKLSDYLDKAKTGASEYAADQLRQAEAAKARYAAYKVANPVERLPTKTLPQPVADAKTPRNRRLPAPGSGAPNYIYQ